MDPRTYLDIETSFSGEITVLGLFFPPEKVIQFIGGEVNKNNVMNVLKRTAVIITYNGSRFDLPVIKRKIDLDLRRIFKSRDLMYDCRREGLFGGLKVVEKKLGISRETEGISGKDAPHLWDRYIRFRDIEALELLLKYNRDDVINLYLLEERLNGFVSAYDQDQLYKNEMR